MSTKFDDYRDRFPNIAFKRTDGVVEMRVHTAGGSLHWGALDTSIHAQLGYAFREVALDAENRVVIFTGTGADFCTSPAQDEHPEMSAAAWSRLMREGRDLLTNFLDIEVPVVSVLNGPATIHSELAVMGDVVIAAAHASVRDAAHIPNGVVPGDGVHTIWLDLLGPNRGRHFLLTGLTLSASELQSAGVVAEVLPVERLMARAYEIARPLAALPPMTARYTRLILTQRMKRRMLDELGYGLALEGLSIAALTEKPV